MFIWFCDDGWRRADVWDRVVFLILIIIIILQNIVNLY